MGSLPLPKRLAVADATPPGLAALLSAGDPVELGTVVGRLLCLARQTLISRGALVLLDIDVSVDDVGC